MAPHDDIKWQAASSHCSHQYLRRREEEERSEGSSRDAEDPAYTEAQAGTCCQLVTDLSINFTEDQVFKIPMGKHRPLDGPWDLDTWGPCSQTIQNIRFSRGINCRT